ncbi:DUF2911 domain-containing protein [Sabulilitoribacter multivorans]|uniref:DUF2911 domain-containing protein n=1 Tax=Flaviramulus multivorans TaxID=1304750 RepID=A0ABS9ILZ9_9FLAO|nr:DUF2911 domain-containing protein [Flaviramulus multivorans]MCF7561593.1 DUF2911 domain-containing protein [Flaviramulus multivorans]
MKNLIAVFVLTVSVLSCNNQQQKKEEHNHQETQTQQEDVPKKKPLSPHTSAMAMIGDAHIHIDYSSPGVRGRIIFGGLVGYDNVWQAGAHMATWIETNKDLIINDEVLPKGKYGFFTIPSKDDWTIMINKNWNQHGKDDYNENDDVIRFKVTPSISDKNTEHLEYKVNKISETEGSISLAWEKVTIRFPFKINQ